MLRKPHSSLLIAAAGLLTGAAPLLAQYYSGPQVVGVAERELARRQERVFEAEELLQDGKQAMNQNDYERAVDVFGDALLYLPDSLATSREREIALKGFSEASVKYAEQLIMQGRRQDAETILKRVIEPGVNPGYRPAYQVLANMEDPGYYNPSVTPGFVEKVEQVKTLLVEAQGFYDLGRYDLAFKRYEQVLNIDKYNIAARKGMERVNHARTKYSREAYNETRSRLLWQVDKAWELPVRDYGLEDPDIVFGTDQDKGKEAAIQRKLDSIILPVVTFRDATVREAIEFLKQESARLDVAEPDPTRKGVNIVLRLPSAGGAPSAGAPAQTQQVDPITGAPIPSAAPSAPAVGSAASAADARIRLNLTNIPLGEALRYVTDLAGLKYKVEPYAVLVVPQSESTEALITKEFRVPPDFLPSGPVSSAAPASTSASPFGFPASGSGAAPPPAPGSALSGRAEAKEYLESLGVSFPEGATARYLRSSSKLIVKNTQSNLDIIEDIVESEGVTLQVDIETKFIEVQQDKLRELGFDWLLGAFNVGNESVFASGGTAGNGIAVDNSNFPFVAPGASAPVGTNPVTAGNRTGTTAITGDSIAALLAGATGGGSLVAPAVFGLAGVFTDPQFQVVIRALNQSKAIDLMSAPRVVTQSGEKATIEIVREFIYPGDYEPPQLPNEVGTGISVGGGGAIGGSSVGSFPVTPATPTDWQMRPTGVTLEVEPQVGPDRYTIDLRLVPTVTEFEGFINYGSPITTAAIGPLGVAQQVVLTENIINQPVFSTRKVQTKVSIWDGQTVKLGGLMREDIQKVDDKVPLLGDIPIAGRLFRSTSEQHLKRNLIIFVTARLLDPAGQLINEEEEEEEVVEPLIGPDSPEPPPSVPIYAK